MSVRVRSRPGSLLRLTRRAGLRAIGAEGGQDIWRAVAAIARLEWRRMRRHPLFLVALAMALIGPTAFAAAALRDQAADWGVGWMIVVSVGIFGLLTMVVANYAALRDRRERTGEHQQTLPSVEPAKTGGLLLAGVMPAVVAGAVLGATAGVAATSVRFEDHELVFLVEVVLHVPMFAALGVALARWLPHPVVSPLVAWGVFLATPDSLAARWEVLSPFADIPSLELAMWHLAYGVGLTVTFASAAVLRRVRTAAVIGSAVAGLLIVMVALGVLLTRVTPALLA